MINFQNITKTYGNHTVLNEFNLQIRGQEFVSIVGPSGVGKSTLIHLLIGAEKPTKGDVLIDEYIINKMDDKMLQLYRRQVGVVFQDFRLLPKKNVWENVAFVLEACGKSKSEIEKRVPEALEIVGLLDKQDSFPNELSGGESQRVSIARAIAHRPRVLVADEPTGNLDPDTAKEIIKLLLKINEYGTTVILATHDKDIVDFAKQRVVKLGEGKVVSDREKAEYN